MPLADMQVLQSELHTVRLDRLRQADSIVRRMCQDSGFEKQVWQFPVILIPAGTPDLPDSVVLRPIHSVDGMTAQSVTMPEDLLTPDDRRDSGRGRNLRGVLRPDAQTSGHD